MINTVSLAKNYHLEACDSNLKIKHFLGRYTLYWVLNTKTWKKVAVIMRTTGLAENSTFEACDSIL